MKTEFRIAIYSILAAGMALAAAGIPAYASRGDLTNFAAIRHDTAEPGASKLISIEGALTCDLGDQNNGQACELKLHEAGTGRTYSLIQARSAMILFQKGDKNVRIQGRLDDPQTIEVRSAQTL